MGFFIVVDIKTFFGVSDIYGMVVCIHTNKISFLQFYNFTWSLYTIYQDTQ